MSKDSLGSYILSEAQKKRLEKERIRRQEEERLRLEELRRKEIERKQQEEVRAQKNRINVIKEFKEISSALQQKKHVVRENKLKEQSSQEKYPNKSAEMQEVSKLMKKQLQALSSDPEWRQILKEEISKVEDVLYEVETDEFDPFHWQRLKWAQRSLNKLMIETPRMVEEFAVQLKQARELTDRLLANLQLVEKQAVFNSHKRLAIELISQLDYLASNEDPQVLIKVFPKKQAEVHNLLDEFNKVQERDQARHFVMENVREVLTGMGYRNIDIPSLKKTSFEEMEPIVLHFVNPELGAVEIACGLDHSIHAEFIHLKSAGDNSSHGDLTKEEYIYRGEQWCRDYDLMIGSLSERDISFKEHWRTPPAQGSYRELVVSEELLEKEVKNRFSSKPKRRMNQ